MQRLLKLALLLGAAACLRPPGTCTDGVRNGQESDVDCGGPDCAPCESARACHTHGDCASGRCRRRVCVAPQAQVDCRRNADCPAGVCLDGACVGPCPAPLSPCADGCTDVRFDPGHCGACGQACAGAERCEQGSCRLLCPPGTLACGAAPDVSCVDTRVDVLHCGSCTTACALGQSCRAGVCVLECAAFQTACSGACVSTLTDAEHCGGCSRPCGPGRVCSMGTCRAACQAPAVVCDGGWACVDVRFDPRHCGQCGAPCPPVPNAQPLCLDQVCTRTPCNPGFADCNGLPADGCEAELALDPMNCGACGRSCLGGPCLGGSCS